MRSAGVQSPAERKQAKGLPLLVESKALNKNPPKTVVLGGLFYSSVIKSFSISLRFARSEENAVALPAAVPSFKA